MADKTFFCISVKILIWKYILFLKKQFEENKIGLAMKNLLREINCRSLGIFAAKPSSEIWHNKAKKYLSTQKWEKCKSQDGARGKILD